MNADNKIINGLWISPNGKPLSNLERLCIYSFCANGHDFQLWTYGDIPNIPTDTIGGKVEICDGNEILSEDKIFTCRGSLAGFADWFRWELMKKRGGWYVDMDMVCIHPFDFNDEIIFGAEKTLKGGDSINPNVLKFPMDNAIAKAMANACANPNKIMPWDDISRKCRKIKRMILGENQYEKQRWGESGGPKGFTKAIVYFKSQGLAKPPHYFSPINYWELEQFIDDSLYQKEMLEPLLKNSYGIHFYHNLLNRTNKNMDSVHSYNSPFEVLKRCYLPV